MRILRALAAPVFIVLLSTILLYDRLKTDFVAEADPSAGASVLGKSYGPVLLTTYADGWIAAANALEQGKSVAEAQEILQSTWKAERIKAFRARVQPQMGAVLSEGTEPASPAQRALVVRFWRNFAAGLKQGAGR